MKLLLNFIFYITFLFYVIHYFLKHIIKHILFLGVVKLLTIFKSIIINYMKNYDDFDRSLSTRCSMNTVINVKCVNYYSKVKFIESMSWKTFKRKCCSYQGIQAIFEKEFSSILIVQKFLSN